MASDSTQSKWVIHRERLVDENPHIRLSVATVELPDGTVFDQYVMRMPRASVAAVLNQCTGFRKQRWAGLSFPDSGPIRIAPYTNENAPLGVSSATSVSGQATLEPFAFGQPSQVWIKTATTGGYLMRWGYNAGWCLDAPQVAAGEPVTVQPCDGSQNQVFVISNDGGYPEMFHPAMDQSLCLAAVPPSVSETVTLQACDATNSSQIWWYYHTD